MIIDQVMRTFRNSNYRNPEPWFMEWFHGGQETDSGNHIGPHSALKYAPYFQAISIISGDIGKIPLPLYKRTDAGRERDKKHPAYRLMMFDFNEAMTADVGSQILQSHALSWGNGRGAILRNNSGDPQAIVPLLPDRTETKVVDGEVWHITKVGVDQETRAYRDENVLHIKGLGFDGITGYSVATMARNSLGLGLSSEQHGSYLFKNLAVPGVVLQCDGKVSEPDAKKLLADWDRYHSGAENRGKTGLLHSGIKAVPLSMASNDAQWLETRKFQRVEVASWFNLPPHKLGDETRISYNSLEQENLSYLNGCLLFWFVRWQGECRRKLLREREKENDTNYFEFFIDILASVDFPAKVAALNTLVAATIFNPNEAREKLNMNHREGGDVYENPNTNSRLDAEAKPPLVPPQPPQPPKAPKPKQMLELMAKDVRFQGPKGEPGENGGDGASAYLIAVVSGFAGTEDEWLLSLVGKPGVNGEPGSPGKDGAPGLKGEAGPPSLYGRCLDVMSAAVAQEASIVRHHADKAKNFTGWHENWYPKWQEKFTADIVRLGADKALAVEHCDESQRQIVALTERATFENLVGEVTSLTASWHERAVVLARRIAGGELPNAALEPETLVSTPHGLGKVAAIESDWRYQVELQDGTTQSVSGADVEVLG